MKKMITKTNRDRIANLLPALNNMKCGCDRAVHWNMFRLLAFSAYRDENTGAVRVGQEALARVEGKMDALKSNNYSGKQFLIHAINDLFPGMLSVVVDESGRDWSTASWSTDASGNYYKTEEGKQRRVIVNFSSEIETVINDELNGLPDNLVYIDTGLKKNAKKDREELKLDREEANLLFGMTDSPRARYMANYLNKLPTNKFTALADNFVAAEQELNNIKNPSAKRIQKLILETIKERPIPVYVPTKKSDRLFTRGASMQNLKKNVRKALTQGWFEFDLSSAQLAIIAYQWKIPEVSQFLANGGSLWRELLTHLNVSDAHYEDVKSIVKDFVYGLIFGMGETRIVTELTEYLLPYNVENAGNKFLSHPIISLVLEARRRRVNQLLKNGFYAYQEEKEVDPKERAEVLRALNAGELTEQDYNCWLSTKMTLKTVDVTKHNVLSVLAQQAQRLEQVLIYPAFQLLDQTSDFSIVLYQFDGFSVSFNNNAKKEYWINRIVNAVNETAANIGINTSLVWEENPVIVDYERIDDVEVAGITIAPANLPLEGLV